MPESNTSYLQSHHELLANLEGTVGENLGFLAPIDRAWQPTDFLPDLATENWKDQLADFRDQARQISDELLVVLVGDMVTEEALPNYSVSLNVIARDEQGDAARPWAQWLRGWTAEENRHGDLLNAYLRLTGRVNMRSVELTVHHLIARGFNPKTNEEPYGGLVYTSFQERATRISHGNVAKLAGAQGDANLAKICQRISGDESRHETFYTRMFDKVLDLDASGGVLAFRDMMRGLISMPGRLMYDGKIPDLFDQFAAVAQRLEVYTVHDYARIIDHLVKTWRIGERSVSGPAAKAQDYLCRQAERYATFADRIREYQAARPPARFSWIYDRSA